MHVLECVRVCTCAHMHAVNCQFPQFVIWKIYLCFKIGVYNIIYFILSFLANQHLFIFSPLQYKYIYVQFCLLPLHMFMNLLPSLLSASSVTELFCTQHLCCDNVIATIYEVCEWDDMSFWTSWESFSFSSYSTFRLCSVMLNPALLKQCSVVLEVTGFHATVTRCRACTKRLNLVLFFYPVQLLSSAPEIFCTWSSCIWWC